MSKLHTKANAKDRNAESGGAVLANTDIKLIGTVVRHACASTEIHLLPSAISRNLLETVALLTDDFGTTKRRRNASPSFMVDAVVTRTTFAQKKFATLTARSAEMSSAAMFARGAMKIVRVNASHTRNG